MRQPSIRCLASTLANPWTMLGWHTLFMGLTIFVVARGVERGLERAVRILMPALLVMLLMLLVYSIRHGDFMAAVIYMFSSKLVGPVL